MPSLTFEDVTVTAFIDRERSPARVAVCSCGCRTFLVYTVRLRSNHTHLQCTACDTSYCDGACATDEPCPRPEEGD